MKLRHLTWLMLLLAVPLVAPAGTLEAASPVAPTRLAAPCTPGHLKIGGHLVVTGQGLAGGGSLTGSLTFTNTGTLACSLGGWPVVNVVNATHRVLNVGFSPVRIKKRTAAVTLTPAGKTPMRRATVTLQWLNWCHGKVKGPLSLAVTISTAHKPKYVSLHGATLTPSCVNPKATSVLHVGPYLRSA